MREFFIAARIYLTLYCPMQSPISCWDCMFSSPTNGPSGNNFLKVWYSLLKLCKKGYIFYEIV